MKTGPEDRYVKSRGRESTANSRTVATATGQLAFRRSIYPRHRLRGYAVTLLSALSIATGANSEEFLISGIQPGTNGQVIIQYPSEPGYRFTLLHGTTVADVHTPLLTNRARIGPDQFAVQKTPGQAMEFYRLQRTSVPPLQPGAYPSVSAGGYHSAALKSDGSLWTWGSDEYGQLGNGTIIMNGAVASGNPHPSQVGTNQTWLAVSAGLWHTIAIAADGTLWSWGRNDDGQLGNGVFDTNAPYCESVPQHVGANKSWAAVSAGAMHTLAVATDHTLWAWGYNGDGELGDGTRTSRNVPEQIGQGKTWAAASAGEYCSIALATDGTLWAWGDNSYGQLGDGTQTNRLYPMAVATNKTWNVVKTSGFHTVAIAADGSLWAWGDNSAGELGDGSLIASSLPVQVATNKTWAYASAGGDDFFNYPFTMAVVTDGTLWGWGGNVFAGQLGDGTFENQPLPAQVATNQTWAGVSAGGEHTVALASDGTLWSWGNGSSGQLGDGRVLDQVSPQQVATNQIWAAVSAGCDHTVTIAANGTLWGWGYNADGRVGDGTLIDRAAPVAVGTTQRWASVSAGYRHTLGLTTDGQLWAWGDNYYGELGDGTLTNRSAPVLVTPGKTWSAFSAGIDFSMAIDTSGNLWAWGDNSYGQFGNGTQTGSTVPIPVAMNKTWSSVSTSWGYTLAVATDGSLWAWGVAGTLGDGDSSDNESLPVPIGTNRLWAAVSAGISHAMAITADGSLWVWGENAFGEFGDGDLNVGYSSDLPEATATNKTWTAVDCGRGVSDLQPEDSHYSCGLATDGTLWAWGITTLGSWEMAHKSTGRVLSG